MTQAYSRQAWEGAQAAWAAGDFGPAWEPYRRLAAEAGFIYPPVGVPTDDRDAESPSPRAIVWTAIVDTPRMLAALIAVSSSWAEVVAGILGDIERRREDVEANARDATWARREEPTCEQAAEVLHGILGLGGTSSPAVTPQTRAHACEGRP